MRSSPGRVVVGIRGILGTTPSTVFISWLLAELWLVEIAQELGAETGGLASSEVRRQSKRRLCIRGDRGRLGIIGDPAERMCLVTPLF